LGRRRAVLFDAMLAFSRCALGMDAARSAMGAPELRLIRE
jgi:hypothetical protein